MIPILKEPIWGWIDKQVQKSNESPDNKQRQSEIAIQQAEYDNRVLDVESIKRWVEALKSGKYLQKAWTPAPNKGRTTVLKYYKGYKHFSALGLLCEVTKELTGGKWNGEWFLPANEEFTKGGNQENILLPAFVEKKLGIKIIKSDLIPSGDINQLARMGAYLSFKQIAIIVESEYLNQ